MNFIHVLFSVCCNRNSFVCAIHALVENVIAFILSCLLIHYDDQQLKTRYLSIFTWTDGNQNEIIRTLLKSQLAMAVLMLVSNVAFAGLFVWVCIKVFWLQRGQFSNGGPSEIVYPSSAVPRNPTIVYPAMQDQGRMSVRAPNEISNKPPVTSRNNEWSSTHDIACPNCGHMIPNIS